MQRGSFALEILLQRKHQSTNPILGKTRNFGNFPVFRIANRASLICHPRPRPFTTIARVKKLAANQFRFVNNIKAANLNFE